MQNLQDYILQLFPANTTLMDCFIDNLSQFYYLDWNTIDKYANVLNWRRLCKNRNIFWDKEHIAKYVEHVHWKQLCLNETVPWDVDLMETFTDYIDLNCLLSNFSVKWNIEFIDKHKEKFDWDRMFKDVFRIENDKIFGEQRVNYFDCNPFFKSTEICDKFSDYMNFFAIFKIYDFPFTTKFIREYLKKKYHLINILENKGFCNFLSMYSANDPKFINDIIFLAKYCNNTQLLQPLIDYKNTSFWSKLFYQIAEFKKDENYNYDLINYILDLLPKLSNNEYLPWSPQFLNEYKNWLDFKKISGLTRLKWSKELISAYIDLWDWNALSANPSIDWNIDIIETFKDNIDWNCLSSGYNWTIELIEYYQAKINWNGLSSGYNWTIELIEYYQAKINWEYFFKNSNIFWTSELINKIQTLNTFKSDKIDWEHFFRNNGITTWSPEFIDSLAKIENVSFYPNPYLPWSLKFLLKYGGKFAPGLFDIIEETSDGISLNVNLISELCRLFYYEIVEINIDNMSTISKDDVYKYLTPSLNPLSYNLFNLADMKLFVWDDILIDRYILTPGDGINKWYYFSNCKGVNWSRDLLLKYKDKFDWKYLCENISIKWDQALIELFNDNIDWEGLSKNNGQSWNQQLIERYVDKWNWKLLSGNTSIKISKEFVEKHLEKWDWEKLSLNEAFYTNLELIEQFKELVDWRFLSQYTKNRNFKFSFDLLEKFKDKWRWDDLSQSVHFPWSKELVSKFKTLWNTKILKNESIHKIIPLNDLYDMLDYDDLKRSPSKYDDTFIVYNKEWTWDLLIELFKEDSNVIDVDLCNYLKTAYFNFIFRGDSKDIDLDHSNYIKRRGKNNFNTKVILSVGRLGLHSNLDFYKRLIFPILTTEIIEKLFNNQNKYIDRSFPITSNCIKRGKHFTLKSEINTDKYGLITIEELCKMDIYYYLTHLKYNTKYFIYDFEFFKLGNVYIYKTIKSPELIRLYEDCLFYYKDYHVFYLGMIVDSIYHNVDVDRKYSIRELRQDAMSDAYGNESSSGWDRDTLSVAFENDPSNYWNID